MDQAPKSTDQRRTDQNNNSQSKPNSECSCTNISIMQLFHEMKQEFPKVPDHIVQQHVTDNCHNRRECIDQLRQATTTSPTTQMYPSKSIHSKNQQTPRSPINGVKWANNQKMKEISEMFENSSSDSSTSDKKLGAKRPTTLPLRRAPDPPSCSSTPSSTTSLSTSSISSPNQPALSELNSIPQLHHNVTLDSSATKYGNDSLNVQLNVTVSPISSTAPPIPPRPTKQTRHVSQMSLQPEPAFTSMLEPKKPSPGETSVTSGTTAQRSYTSVNFTLRQPTSLLPSPQTPIDIQAGPSSLTYSSSSFDAKQGYQSHLKITVAGNGESCIQAVRTKQPTGYTLPEVNQIDTTISIGGGRGIGGGEPITIVSNSHNQQRLPAVRMTDDELRQLIQKQMKQKELLECELIKEREKLEMVRFDIKTLTTPMMTRSELQRLCDEISMLRQACKQLAEENDVAAVPRSPAAISPSRPQRPPPPIPAALRCLSLHQSPFHSQQSPFSPDHPSAMNYPGQPPSYSEVMRETGAITSSLPNLDDVNGGEWSCSMCTFLNYPLLNQCEQCDMPRVQGITITSSSYRPLRQNNQLQGASSSVATNHDNGNIVQATAL